MRARKTVTRHYQWMIKTDFLPRICDPAVVNDVFTNGRKAFEVGVSPTQLPTMPIEFSVAAYRLGHSMVRAGVQLERRLRRRRGHAQAAVRLLGDERQPRRRLPAAVDLDRRFPPALQLRPGRPAGPRRAGCQVQPRDADRREPRASAREASSGDDRSAEGADEGRAARPRVPKPDAREDGQPRHRTADGDVPEEQGREREGAHGRADPPGRRRRRLARRSDRRPSAMPSSPGHRSGSTSCARPS